MMKRMTAPLRLALIVFFLLAKIVGCGSGGGGGEGPDSNGPTPGPTPTPASPSILSTAPGNGATGVPLDTLIRANFSEEMDSSTLGPATMWVQTGNRRIAGKIRAEGTGATFIPSALLQSSTSYLVTVTTGAKGRSGRAVQENYSWTFTTAAAADTQAPTVSKTLPLNGAMNVATNTVLSVTFSEEIDPATLTADTLHLQSDGRSVSGAVQVAGKTANLTPSPDLRPETLYTATITSGVKDRAGNPLAANFVWSFRTGESADRARPVLLMTQPTDQATQVAVDRAVMAIFNEPIDVSSLNAESITLTSEGKTVAGRIAYSGTTAMFIPLEELRHDAVYQAMVTTGVRDAAGNHLGSERRWTFTTETLRGAASPQVLSTRPGSGETGADIRGSVSATFDHEIDPASVNLQTFLLRRGGDSAPIGGSVTYDPNTHSVYFIPREALSPAAVYQALLTTGVRDPSGNALSREYAWTFTTERQVVFLSVAPSILTFQATPGGTPPAAQSLTLSQKSGGPVRWSLSTDLSWLTLSHSSGVGPATVTASIATTQLDPGVYEGSVTVTASGGEASPKKIPVRYTVAPSAACLGRTRPPYVAFVTADSATIAWECAPQGRVEWGTAPDFTERLEVGAENGNKHFAILPHLASDTAYVYRVTTNEEAIGSGTFQTAKGPGENNFSFVIFGDSGEGTSAQKAIASVMRGLNFSFGMIVGDVIYDGGYETEFDPNYFAPYKSLIDHLPFFPVVGNHDLVADRGATFKQNFFHPQGNLYYDFYWGDTHFIALNSTYSDDPAQRAWLDQTLAGSTARWKIVYFHHPPYNSGIFGNNPYIQRDFVPILEKYHVDVVFTGHAHSYERTFPINQITYFVTGGGGGGLTPIGKSEFTAYADSLYHLLLAEMTPDTLTVKAIDRNGAVFDSVAISKSETAE